MIWLLALLFAALPTYLIRFHLGPLPTTVLEILVWITVAVWGILKIKNREKIFIDFKKHQWLLTPIGLFLMGAGIGIAVSPDLRAALGEWRAFYFEPLVIALVIVDSVKSKADAHKILFGLLLGSLSVSILAVYQHFTGWLVPYSFWANRSTYRVTGWYGFPNSVGILLAPLIPVAVYLGLQTLAKIKTHCAEKSNYVVAFLLAVFLITSPLAIVYAKTTAALVGLAAGAGMLLLCFKKTRWPAVAAGIIGLIALFVIPNNAITNELLARDYSGQLRRDIWSETITYLKIHPLVGTGIAGYTQAITPFRNNKNIEVFHHPHNIFLTMWVNIGLSGLIGFVGILGWFFAQTIKQLQSNSRAFAITLLVTMAIWLTMGLVDSPYIKNDWALIFWLLIALGSHQKFNS